MKQQTRPHSPDTIVVAEGRRFGYINPIESQTEYVLAMQRGYQFARHGNIAHYLFPRDLVEPSVLAKLPPASHYVFTFIGCTLASCDGHRCAITPTNDALNWLTLCHRIAIDLEEPK